MVISEIYTNVFFLQNIFLTFIHFLNILGDILTFILQKIYI